MNMASPIPGRIVKAADFDTEIGTPLRLRADAEDIISRAETAAREVRTLAAQEREKLTNMIRTISDEELKAHLDLDTLRNNAAVFAGAMESITAMKRDFDAIQPWLTRLVEDSLRRIIGTLDAEETVARIVAQAAREIDPGQHSVVRAGTRAFVELREAQVRYPRYFEGIAAIQPDASLDENAIFLECPIGITEISLDTQIDTLLDFLATRPSAGDAAE